MKDEKIIYQIKMLEKLIFRYFLSDIDCDCNQMPTPTQMQIIEYILMNEEKEVHQKDLEEILNLRRATVSGVLQTMEKNNLIERITDSNDARTKKIILNENAKKIFTQSQNKFKEVEEILVKNISKEELNNFSQVLNKMIKSLKESN